MQPRIRAMATTMIIVVNTVLLLGLTPRTPALASPGLRAVAAPPVAHVYAGQDTVPWYLAVQADSGEAVFKRTCAECHEKVDINGADFRAKWAGRPVYSLFERIRNSMPDSDPGSLPIEDYTYVVAYILKLNGIPPNANRLVADSVALRGAKLLIAAPGS